MPRVAAHSGPSMQRSARMQVIGGNTVSGRTCATALPCVERQGLLWVCPKPGATISPDAIAGALLCVTRKAENMGVQFGAPGL